MRRTKRNKKKKKKQGKKTEHHGVGELGQGKAAGVGAVNSTPKVPAACGVHGQGRRDVKAGNICPVRVLERMLGT